MEHIETRANPPDECSDITPAATGSAAPGVEPAYAAAFGNFSLDAACMQPAPPAGVMRENEHIGPFLRRARRKTQKERMQNAAVGVLLVVATAAAAWFGNWDIFWRYQQPELQAEAGPTLFALNETPDRFRADVADVNALVESDRRFSLHNALKALRDKLSNDLGADAFPLKERVLLELLSLTESMSGGAYAEAGTWYSELAEVAAQTGQARPPFRGMQAYAFILERHEAPASRKLLAHLADLRAEYGAAADQSQRLLALEIRSNLLNLPVWRRTEPDFSTLWLRADASLAALKKITGESMAYLRLELFRWQRLLDTFYFFSSANSTVKIAGNEYPYSFVETQAAHYRGRLSRMEANI